MMILRVICFLGFLVNFAACANSSRPTEQPSDSQTEWVEVIPVKVEQYVRGQYLGQNSETPMLVVIEYSIPYDGAYQVIQLMNDNTVFAMRVVPNWAIQAMQDGTLNKSEKDRIRESIDFLHMRLSGEAIWPLGSVPGQFMIWFGYPTASGYDLLSCAENSCPSEVCTIYSVADDAFKRSGRAGMACPISDN
ncbi:MAG TPA: hypothetical protein VFL17_08360 [Anaerolineae bacterium]|nr:hypothetical protein [Anaerolineae bacterium]